MIVDRRTFLTGGLAAAGLCAITGGCARRGSNSPIALAARYLWSQQAEDGGFHSSTYGLLRSGQSLTPFVLAAILDLPRVEEPPYRAVDRAISFIKANVNSEGVLGVMDATAADYPNYATALGVSALIRTGATDYEKVVEPMITQLRAQQFSEENGWTPQHPSYGGWGMGGPIHHPPEAGHVDLSMTRHVLEALKLSGVQSSDPVMARALTF